MFKKLVISSILMCLSLTGVLANSCQQCMDIGNRLCLNINDFNEATCCKPDSTTGLCANQLSNIYCATNQSIAHPYLKDFVCPASIDYCPNTM